MKKIVTILAVTIALSTVGINAFAATANTSKIDDRIAKIQQQQQKIEQAEQNNQTKISSDTLKLPQLNAFRQALMQDRINVLNNQDKNLQLRDENKTLRLSLENAIKAIKESGSALPKDTLAELKADNQQISQIWAGISATKGQIQALNEQNKTAVKNKDSAALDANFQKIYSIQTSRNQQLQQINSILQQMNSLLADNKTSSSGSASSASSSSDSSSSESPVSAP
jgi:rhamnose utilization protein RhaD (predicted bifunctional aldolase and dehydrogenase)